MSHDDLAEAEIIFNLCKEYQQEWLLKYCIENGIKVVFLDNISCLCFCMKKNEPDSWEQVLEWLLRLGPAGIAGDDWFNSLRTNKITPAIIHHANRNNSLFSINLINGWHNFISPFANNRDGNEMLGISKREDLAD